MFLIESLEMWICAYNYKDFLILKKHCFFDEAVYIPFLEFKGAASVGVCVD
ncbi:MAG: hypothetical protein H6695_18250 [Deferribacteres bacterium]|nr:hypothetical protein [candidate division KSB1 bacterium]MCB9512127.1 hypothetical protein [Deferribacteres bacterium]